MKFKPVPKKTFKPVKASSDSVRKQVRNCIEDAVSLAIDHLLMDELSPEAIADVCDAYDPEWCSEGGQPELDEILDEVCDALVDYLDKSLMCYYKG